MKCLKWPATVSLLTAAAATTTLQSHISIYPVKVQIYKYNQSKAMMMIKMIAQISMGPEIKATWLANTLLGRASINIPGWSHVIKRPNTTHIWLLVSPAFILFWILFFIAASRDTKNILIANIHFSPGNWNNCKSHLKSYWLWGFGANPEAPHRLYTQATLGPSCPGLLEQPFCGILWSRWQQRSGHRMSAARETLKASKQTH